MDLYKLLRDIDKKYDFLNSKDNFLNIGCKEGGALSYASEVIEENMIIGMELDERFKEDLMDLSGKKENIKIMYENPLKESTWENAKFKVKSILNSLGIEPIKTLQATENSLKALIPGGRIAVVYSQGNKDLIENFLLGLPVRSTEFFTHDGKLISISEKKKGSDY